MTNQGVAWNRHPVDKIEELPIFKMDCTKGI